ncbi:ChrR family anti-sigma-E factor [Algibacillus agarilyticus]|uniref:ChrR family anti-sigma-E factor n=1 Tax=Algibacillus agarilyticus TaxID=2234133 RepID=UPI000DCF823B|nr:ChrR family anti-sigma-E factor [Algibacillus agarilyticus]
MINHHPKSELINAFVAGELPTALSVIVASHLELCRCCNDKAKKINQHQADDAFSDADLSLNHNDNSQENTALDNREFANHSLEDNKLTAHHLEVNNEFADMFAAIVADKTTSTPATLDPVEIKVKDNTYVLPKALSNIQRASWFKLGKLSRSNLDSSENEIHSHLIHIEAGGEIPQHTHNGYEVTLILSGDFYDELGEYSQGDFMWLDKQHKHQPKTKNGCLCLTVANDALHFTQGVGKILNPIGSLIY